MRQCAFHWCAVAGLLLLGTPFLGQARSASEGNTEKTPSGNGGKVGNHIAYVQDWSSSHLLMPGARVEDVLATGKHDPRMAYNLMRRRAALRTSPVVPLRPVKPRRKSGIDWAVSMENGYVSPDQTPAKYGYDIDTEDCDSDYVVYALTVATPSFTQANVVGINNLYTSATPECNGGTPFVAFAYNTQTQTDGQIYSSPTISEDGTKVAFVESTSTGQYFHVLVLPNPIPTPPASAAGTVLSPAIPTSCPGGNPTIPGCMTTLIIETTASNSISSPWIDFNNDAAYVGSDDGMLYKIIPVFNGGAPLLITNGNWPVTVSTSGIPILTDPVVDDVSDRIFLGDLDGYLYAVTLHGPGGVISAKLTIGELGFQGAGIVDPPIVATDVANPTVDQVFAFTGCSNLPNIGGAVAQVPANFTSSTTPNTVSLSNAVSGAGTCTGGNVHAGTFDNNFLVNGSLSGHMLACGFNSTGGFPRVYMLPFLANVITSPSDSFMPDTTAGDECSPLTDFFDGTTDRLFFGVGDAYLNDATPDGFVESATINPLSFTPPSCSNPPTSNCVTVPPVIEGVSGIIIDNDLSDGGSNIYFTTLAAGSVNGQSCFAGGTLNPYCAVKLTQSGLN